MKAESSKSSVATIVDGGEGRKLEEQCRDDQQEGPDVGEDEDAAVGEKLAQALFRPPLASYFSSPARGGGQGGGSVLFPSPACGGGQGGGRCLRAPSRGDDLLGRVQPGLVLRSQGGDRRRRQVTRWLKSRDLLIEDELQPLDFLLHQPKRERGELAV